MARTVGHLESIDIEALVEQQVRARPDFHDLDYHELQAARLLARSFVDTVIDEARSVIQQRMTIDIAMRLLPRLEGRTP